MRQVNIYSLGNDVSEAFKALKLHALCSARATERVLICIVEAARRIVGAQRRQCTESMYISVGPPSIVPVSYTHLTLPTTASV